MPRPESPLTPAFSMDPLHLSPSAPAEVLERDFTAATVTDLRHAVHRYAAMAGLADDALDGLVIAVHELVTNAVRHGGGQGCLQLRRDGDTLVCDVTDYGTGFSAGIPVAGGPPPTDAVGGRGILLARQLTDTLLITDGPNGVTATVTACLPAAGTATTPVIATQSAATTLTRRRRRTDTAHPVFSRSYDWQHGARSSQLRHDREEGRS